MGFIDGSIINLCTFPGILVHQLFRLTACRYYKVEAAFSLVNFTTFLQSNLVTIGETGYLAYGKRIERLALLGGALVAGLMGAINDFTPKGSAIEWVVFWIAVSTGIQAFPSRSTRGGAVLMFFWIDALYGVVLYFLGQAPLATIKTVFPSLVIPYGSRLF